MDVIDELFKNQDLDYRSFTQGICPNSDKMIGVRVPILKSMAKKLAKSDIVYKSSEDYYEEFMLSGLSIAYSKMDLYKKLLLLDEFVDEIDNWAICDVVVGACKDFSKDKKLVFKYVKKWLKSKDEFRVRFALVTLLNYFIDDQYITDIFKITDKLKRDDYYIKMAMSWLLSICYIKQKEKTKDYLINNDLDDWVYNKTIQKIIESNRITDEEKKVLKEMKRK